MSLLGFGAVAMWWNMAPEMRTEFEDWHSHEHFPERMGIPGFRRGSRWADLTGGTGFFVLYELDDYATLSSPGYLARLNAPTPWSTKMMPHHRDMVRSQCHVMDSFGGGIGRVMLTKRVSPIPGHDDELRRGLVALMKELPETPGLTGAHLLRTETPRMAQTTEQSIRGGDAAADWIILVSGYDADRIADIDANVMNEATFAAMGAQPSATSGLYRLAYSLSETDLATHKAS